MFKFDGKAVHVIIHLSMTIIMQIYDDVFEEMYDRLDEGWGWSQNL